MAKTTPKWLLPLIVLGTAVLIFYYLKSTRAVVEAQPPQERSWIVETMAIKRETHRTHITALGEVIAGRTAVLRPEVPGKIIELSGNFRDGATLAKGAPLITIDRFDYETALTEAKAALTQAKARLEQLQSEQQGQREQLAEAQGSKTLAATEVQRQKELTQRGVATRRNLDDATRTLNNAAQTVAGIKSNIRSLASQIDQQKRGIERAQLSVTRAERDLADTQILAPFDGFLADPNAAIGQQVGLNDTLGRLISAHEMEIRFSLSEANFASLDGPAGNLLNKPVTITWSPGSQPQQFTATITRQAAQTVAASGSIDMFAQFTDPGLSFPLRPGMFVSVKIAETPLQEAVAVPVEALVDGLRLYAVTTDENDVSRLTLADFEHLRRRAGKVYLRTELAPGTQIVTRTFPQIIQGLKVDPRPRPQSPSQSQDQTHTTDTAPTEETSDE